jgi:hypothetical protein
VFAAASAASVATSPATTAAMLAGIGVGSFAWFSILSLGMATLRRRLGQRAYARPTRWPAWACSALVACSAGAPSAPLERRQLGLDGAPVQRTAMSLPKLTTTPVL